MKQETDVLHRLLQSSLTSKEAWQELGVENLPATINRLKNSGALDDIGVIRKGQRPVTWNGVDHKWLAEYYIERIAE